MGDAGESGPETEALERVEVVLEPQEEMEREIE